MLHGGLKKEAFAAEFSAESSRCQRWECCDFWGFRRRKGRTERFPSSCDFGFPLVATVAATDCRGDHGMIFCRVMAVVNAVGSDDL